MTIATPISFRPDPASAEALEELTADGTSPSDAVRSALIEAGARHRSQRLRDEAARLVGDVVDREEAKAVLRDMEDLRAW